MKLRVLVAALMIGGAATACGRNAGVESGQVQPASDNAAVTVTNGYMLALSVYAVDNSNIPMKLGTVEPGMTSSFVIGPGLMRQGMLRIYAQPPGGGRIVGTGPLPVEPGNVVEFNIGPNLMNNTTTIK